MEQTVQPCPQCGAEILADRRYVAWCAACDWNVDPDPEEEEPGRLERRRRAAAARHGERLLAEIEAAAGGDGNPLKPRSDTAGVLAYAIALAVHGVTLALIVAGVLLVVVGWGSALPVVGAFCLFPAWVLRPRFRKLPDDGVLLRRGDAPRLFALIDEIAVLVGTTGVDAIAITPEVNAGVSAYGMKQRRLLTIGLGLWEILSPQERVALLGHELGHYANGDTRHGVVISNALRSLVTWRYVLHPVPRPEPVEYILNLLYVLPFCTVHGVMLLLDRLTLRATQRGEYLADTFAARAGSTEAATGLMDRLLVGESASVLLQREFNSGQIKRSSSPTRRDPWVGLWDRLATEVHSVPQSEYERQRRVSILRGHSVDSTHPPTHLRRTALLAGTPVDAGIVVDAAQQDAIDGELTEAREQVAKQVFRGW
ncbi:M48 family metallopeptidase [Streptomyces sp. NPDC050738]|uniref:M48 family metallopeptidase n=1 Tax=Streptomyces sp. NPDC050738 TaxID=3154744 RepID=UPI003444A39F